MQKSNMKMNVLDFRSIGQDNTLICQKTLLPTVFSFFFHLKKSWKMIFKKVCLIATFCHVFLLPNLLIAEEKFEALIASVNSEAITTYDLSQRIKLVLKSKKAPLCTNGFSVTDALNIREFLYNITEHSPPSFDQA